MRRITLLILFLNSFYSYCQQIQNIDSFFRNFKKDVLLVQQENAGKVVFDDDTKISYYTLLENSSVQDLLDYTNDDNAFIRSYIFGGLLRKGLSEQLALKILENHKNDTAKFVVQDGCVITHWTVKSYMEFAAKLKSTNDLNDIDYKSAIKIIKNQDVIKLKIDGVRHGNVIKNTLLDIDCLELTTEKIKLVSFSLFVDEQKFNSMSCNLTQDMKLAIENAEIGQVLYFEEIKVLGEDNIERQLASMTLRLK